MAGRISPDARRHIQRLITPWLHQHINRLLQAGPHLPFHAALLCDKDLSVWGEERSFSTALGNKFQAVALILARSIHGNGFSNYSVEGTVPNATLSTIAAIVSDLRTGGMAIDSQYPALVARVTSGYVGDIVHRSAKVDLFYRDRAGWENYFEIKSPKPNRGQCWEATERLLLVHALRSAEGNRVRALYGMPYNPYGEDKSAYQWHHACELLDLKNQVLIGAEFWDFLGGDGTYQELLNLFRQIGSEVSNMREDRR
jgi:hypothetical protein